MCRLVVLWDKTKQKFQNVKMKASYSQIACVENCQQTEKQEDRQIREDGSDCKVFVLEHAK